MFCQLWILLTFASVHLRVCSPGCFLLGFCPLGCLSIWHSVHIGLRPQEGLSNLVWLTCYSVYLWVGPTGCLSTCILSTLESGHMTFLPRRIVPTIGSVNSGFYSHLVLSTWILSSREYGNMTFCPRRIVSTKGFVNSGFCLRLLRSIWESLHLEVYLLGFCPLESLAT